MKTFCILEQSGTINESITLKHKKLFSTDFCDFYRLNWKIDDDPHAFITRKKAIWTEGRNLLYEKVPKEYDYYIFIDDDVDFQSHNEENIAIQIKELLDEYKPIAGTFIDLNSWAFSRTKISESEFLSRPAFPVAGFDAQTHILSRSFAEVMLPIIYHGSHRPIWYTQWVCNQLFPYKQICFSGIQVSNTRHMPQENFHNAPRPFAEKPIRSFGLADLFDKSSRPNEIMWLFNNKTKDKSFNFDINDVVAKNKFIFSKEVEKENIEFSLSDFAKIYDINNPDYKQRVSVVDNKYMSRIIRQRLLIQPAYLFKKLFK